jgi:hypothetical protein
MYIQLFNNIIYMVNCCLLIQPSSSTVKEGNSDTTLETLHVAKLYYK